MKLYQKIAILVIPLTFSLIGACGKREQPTSKYLVSSPYNDAQNLSRAIKERGLEAVESENNLSTYDRSLLSIVPGSEENRKTKVNKLSGRIHIKGEPLRPKPKSPLSKQLSVQDDPAYGVFVTNNSSESLNRVIAFYDAADNVQPGQTVPLTLGKCREMIGYALGVFVHGTMVVKLPPDGVMTPQRASLYHPADQDPCRDFWSVESFEVRR